MTEAPAVEPLAAFTFKLTKIPKRKLVELDLTVVGPVETILALAADIMAMRLRTLEEGKP